MHIKIRFTIIAFLIILIIRCLFCYRIIPFPNSGDLKYKKNEVIYFPHHAFINPFKKNIILTKIRNYISSENFIKQNKSNELNYFKEKSLANELDIISMKIENNQYLILVSSLNNAEAELVFILDVESDIIIGYK